VDFTKFLDSFCKLNKQSTYRGRVEIGECICPLSWIVLHKFVRDGRYSKKGGGRAPPLTIFHFSSLCTLWFM
jgi:hypothetical protein